jgi:hypothetical protein
VTPALLHFAAVSDAVRAKLDAPSRRRLAQLLEAGEASQQVALFLRGSAPFSRDQLDQLKADGASLRTCSGVIATTDVALEAVDRVLRHEFVVSAQISSPLFPEKSR